MRYVLKSIYKNDPPSSLLNSLSARDIIGKGNTRFTEMKGSEVLTWILFVFHLISFWYLLNGKIVSGDLDDVACIFINSFLPDKLLPDLLSHCLY